MTTVLYACLIGITTASLACSLPPLYVVVRDYLRTLADPDREWAALAATVEAARGDFPDPDVHGLPLMDRIAREQAAVLVPEVETFLAAEAAG